MSASVLVRSPRKAAGRLCDVCAKLAVSMIALPDVRISLCDKHSKQVCQELKAHAAQREADRSGWSSCELEKERE